jgi:phosphoglycerol transferase MdoB-like AlkP superfamily enzyme
MGAFIMLMTLLDFFRHASFGDIFKLILFLLITLISIFAVNILNNNYPDTPVTGGQKKTFNRLFLLNFLFLAILFGLIIAEFRTALAISKLLNISFFELPFRLLMMFFSYVLTLIFQFIILYGLYDLRRLLYVNFMKRKFEFEGKGNK